MCTLIATKTKNGVLIGMNRDEVPERAHTEYMNGDLFYPVDPFKKGTWIAVSRATGNASALLSCIKFPSERTRGELVPYVLRTGTLPQNLNCYAPFTLFQYYAKRDVFHITTWEQNTLTYHEASEPVFLASGSNEAIKQRIAYLQNNAKSITGREDLDVLLKSHELKIPATICLHGKEAETIASTIIQYDTENKTVQAYDLIGHPCEEKYNKLFEINCYDKIKSCCAAQPEDFDESILPYALYHDPIHCAKHLC